MSEDASEAASQRAQLEAFEAYKTAKLRADDTLSFNDAMAAKRAWWNFLHIFEAQTANVASLANMNEKKFSAVAGSLKK